MSVVRGHDRLVMAAKQLLAEWQALKETWRDENGRQFEEKYIIPLESEARAAVMAMNRAQAAIHHARRDCGATKGADL